MSVFRAQPPEDLRGTRAELMQRYQAVCDRNLSLDITRGKPCSEQLDLSAALLENLAADDFRSPGGTDCRNYGGIDGLIEARRLFADYMGVTPEEIIIGGNSSLNLMYDTFMRAMVHGVGKALPPWGHQKTLKFICPSPGYDRHFSICEYLGIAMLPVAMQEMDMDTAVESGATALFEEKYGDRVRVISLSTFSRELCGGTHTTRTGNIGLFKILSESSVASGVRRIEAVSGGAALQEVQKNSRILNQLGALVKDKPDGLVQRVESMLTQLKRAEKETEQLKTKMAEMQADGDGDQALQINGVDTVIRQVTLEKPAALRELADRFKDRLGSGIVVLGAEAGGKALLIVTVSKDLADRFHAGKMIKIIAGEVGGGGGGRPDMAQAGGTQPQHLTRALEKAREIIANG